MKRWLCSFLLAVGIAFLLWIPHRAVNAHLRPQGAGDRSVLRQSALVFTGCRALRAPSPVFFRNRAGPLEFLATQFGFLIGDDVGPPWWDYRGPPGPNGCRPALVTDCKAAGQGGSLRGRTFRGNSGPLEGEFEMWGFSTPFS
jgi:hypothetical protein